MADPWKDESGKGLWRGKYRGPYTQQWNEYKQEFYQRLIVLHPLADKGAALIGVRPRKNPRPGGERGVFSNSGLGVQGVRGSPGLRQLWKCEIVP
jgi:hypothetical protein